MQKKTLKLNRPVYVGQAILDLSKTLMYGFYYDTLKPRYGNRVQVLYTYTDSLVLEVQTEDIYADMAAASEDYDTSNYPREHPLFSAANKKVLGKMKDECGGRPIAEFVGLRPKLYSILEAGGANTRKAKGIRKCTVAKDIRHANYVECLQERKTFRHGMNVLRSVGHQIYGQRVTKVSLSPLDTKRWIAPDGITTRAYSHCQTQAENSAALNAYVVELLA
jgi:hypothetical protein